MTGKIEAYAAEKKLFRKNDRIIAAVSGGADSMALLRILIGLRERYGYELAALHVNHGLRRLTADRDEQFVKNFCASRGIPCLTYRVEVRPYAKTHGLSLEEAARILRYRAMEDAAESTGATAIAVAHHRNDQAETVLFQLLRGSGLRGLSGMAPSRAASSDWQFKNRKVRIIRPLLCVEKAEILAYMREQGADWCEDETNASDDPSRNRLRHKVIPALAEIRPDAVEKIAEAAEYLASVDSYLRNEAADWLAAHPVSPAGGRKTEREIPAAEFGKLDGVLRGYIVREVLREMDVPLKDVGRVQIGAISSLAEKSVGKKALSVRGVIAVRTYDGISLRPAGKGELLPEEPEERSEAHFNAPELVKREISVESMGEIPENQYTKWFDYDKIKVPAELRTRRDGDRFSAVSGGHKKLKDVFIDMKIPREERDRILLVASGQDILWIVGYRMSEEYKITPETRRILELSVREREV